MEPIITVNEYPIRRWEWLDRVPLEDFTWLIEIFSTMTDDTDTYDYAGGLIINDTTDYIEIYEIEIEDEPFDEFLGNIITYAIKRWESNHKETEILHQLEISNLLEQLKNN